MSEELSLSERIRQAQIRNELAQAQVKQAKQEAKAQAQAQEQAELDQYNKDVEQYNLDLEQYNKDLAEIERLEKQQNQKSEYEIQKEQITLEYNKKIQDLIDARTQSLINVSREQIIIQKGADIVRPASRKQIAIYESKIYQDYDPKIRELQQTQSRLLQDLEFRTQYPSAVLGRTALNQVKAGLDPITAYEKQQTQFEANRQYQSQKSIKQAQSNAITERAKTEKQIQELAQTKKPDPTFIFNKTPTKAGDLKPTPTPPARTLTQPTPEPIAPNIKAIESFEKTQQAKQSTLEKTLSRTTKPEPITKTIKTESSAFLTKAPGQAKDIIGSSIPKSQQAVFTFEQTQAQQKELYQKLTQAKTTQEAIKIKEAYQKINPYVGTPQKAFTKSGQAEQGVLIEKINISTKEEITASYQPPKETTIIKEIDKEIITTKESNLWGLKDTSGKPLTRTLSTGEIVELKFKTRESAQKYLERTQTTQTIESKTPPTYGFFDPTTGKTIKPDSTILWKQANILLETQVTPPSKADIEFNLSLREALKTNKDIIIYQDTKSAEPLIQEPLLKALTDYGTEFHSLGEDVVSLINPGYERKIKQVEPSLETTLATEIIERGSYAIGITKEPPKESKTITYFTEKIKTPEGVEYLAGSVIASGSVIVASGGKSLLKNPLKDSVKESKILADVAQQIFKKEDSSLARLKELNPEMSQAELIKLKEILYPKGRSEKEINLINLLKEKSPNLSQERIDYIVSQANKADAIKLYQKQTYLKEELKKRFPGMSSKQIEQKVTTMTAKESEDIPYGIEKISEKSYLISAGRESKQAQTPFIVVTFQKSRLGKEIGTFQVYEPRQTVTSPKDIIIQGIQGKELEKGTVITKTRGSKTVQYPSTPYNIQRATDPDSQLAFIGTVKTGQLKDLIAYPKETVESIIESSRKSAILETKSELEALAKMEKSARQQYDLGITQAKPTKSTIPEIKITEIKPTEKPQPKTITTETKPTQTIESLNIKLETPPTQKEKLINLAKEIQTQKASDIKTAQTFRTVTGSTLATFSTTNIKQAQAQKTAQEQPQKIKDDVFGLQRDLTITIPDKIEVTKQRDLLTERNIIKERITEKYKQVTTPRFSLITIPGLGEKTDQGTKLDIITDLTQAQKEYQIFKYPTPPDEPFLKTRLTPGALTIPDLTKKEKETKLLEGKKAKTIYFSWNVNLEEPGRYLPTKDLVVGTSPNILKRTNKIQRQISKDSYRYKLDQQVTSRLDKAITKEDNTFKPTNRKESFKSKVNKSNLRNIDQSLVKKSKFIKKSKFKF